MKKKQIDTKEINLYEDIQTLNLAFFNLAQNMARIKDTHGRQTLLDITRYDLSFINLLCRVGNLPLPISYDIPYQFYLELLGESADNQAKFLKIISKGVLRPSEIRKLIREKAQVIMSHDKKVKVNGWQKHSILLEKELKKMDSKTRVRCLSFIANSILAL